MVSSPSAMAATRLGFSSSRSSMAAGQPLGAGGRHVARIGGEDRLGPPAQGGGAGEQRLVLGRARRQRQLGRRRPRGLAQRQHLPLERILENGCHHILSRPAGGTSSNRRASGQGGLAARRRRRTFSAVRQPTGATLMTGNTTERWGSVQIGLHWLIAALILIQVPAAWGMVLGSPGAAAGLALQHPQERRRDHLRARRPPPGLAVRAPGPDAARRPAGLAGHPGAHHPLPALRAAVR